MMEDFVLLKLVRKLDYYGCVGGSITQILSDIQLFNNCKISQGEFLSLFTKHYDDLLFCIDFIIDELDEETREKVSRLLNVLKNIMDNIR